MGVEGRARVKETEGAQPGTDDVDDWTDKLRQEAEDDYGWDADASWDRYSPAWIASPASVHLSFAALL